MTDREQVRIDIKRELNSYRDLSAEHSQLEEELRRLEAAMYSPGGPNMDGMPRGSGTSNPVERPSIKHLTLLEKYRMQLDELDGAQLKIEEMIEGLDCTERRLARFRYIDGLTWEAVCDRMCYSWRQTHRIHGRMLDKLVDAELARRNKTQDCRECRYFIGCENFSGSTCDLFTKGEKNT